MKKVHIYYEKKDYKYYLMLKLKLIDKYEIVENINESDKVIILFSKNLIVDIEKIDKPYLIIYADNKDMKIKKIEKLKNIHIFINDIRIILKWLDK